MKKIKLLLAAMAALVTMGVQAQSWTASEVGAGYALLYNVGTGQYFTKGNGYGTQASVAPLGGAMTVELKAVGDKYVIRTAVNGTDYGLEHLSGTMYTDQSRNKQSTWTFTQVGTDNGPVYNIISAANHTGGEGSYLTAQGGNSTIVGEGTDGSAANAQWKVYLCTGLKVQTLAAMQNASVENPVEASAFIVDGNFASVKAIADNFWTMEANNYNANGGAATNPNAESWQSAFTLSQTLTDLPNGVYQVTAQAALTDYTNNYDGDSYPVVYAGDESLPFKEMEGADRGSSMTTLSGSFTAGKYVVGPLTVQVTDGNLAIGVRGTRTNTWCIWDNFTLTYFGNVSKAEVLLATYVKAYNEALDAAKAEQAKDMFEADKTAINNAVSENTVDLNNATQEALETATANLNSAAAVAAKAAAKYATYTGVKAAIESKTNVDLTSFVANTDFEAGNINSWTSVAGGNVANNGNFSRHAGTWFVERWQPSNSGGLSDGSFAHDALYLPAGTYVITADAQNIEQQNNSVGGTGLFLYANDEKTEIGAAANYLVSTVLAEDGDLTIKFALENCSGNWVCYDNITLTYFSSASDIFAAAVPGATAILNNASYANVTGAERTALSEAIAATPDNTVAANIAAVENLQTAVNAFVAAAPSYDAYAAYKAETIALFGEDLANTAVATAPTSAAEAQTAIQNLNIAQYNKVASDYPYSLTSKIGDFSTWTGTAEVGTPRAAGTPNSLDWEHWSGVTHPYYEQDGNGYNNAGGWTIKYTKTTTLPAGSYVVKVAARSSAGVTSSVSVKDDKDASLAPTISLPCTGNRARGIAKDGKASWSDSDEFILENQGGGWEWRFVPFTLAAETEVTMTFYAEASSQYQWMSIGDGELLSETNIATAVAYNETADNTIEDEDVANVTMTRKIKEGYNTVVLPFDCTLGQVEAAFGTGAEVYAFSENSADANAITVNFNKVAAGTISKNVPVLIKATAASNEQVFNGVQVVAPTADVNVAGKNIDFVGTYAPIAAIAEGDYFIGNGAIYKSAGNTSMKAFRAYLKVKRERCYLQPRWSAHKQCSEGYLYCQRQESDY